MVGKYDCGRTDPCANHIDGQTNACELSRGG